VLFPVELAPQPSRLLVAGLIVGHLILAVAFVLSSLSPMLIGLAVVGVAANAVASHRRWRQMARLRFVLSRDGTIQVIPPAGLPYEARAGRACRDLGWAVWLAWRCTAEEGRAGQEGILMVPRDALAPEAWRALRVWLRFRSGLAVPEVP